MGRRSTYSCCAGGLTAAGPSVAGCTVECNTVRGVLVRSAFTDHSTPAERGRRCGSSLAC